VNENLDPEKSNLSEEEITIEQQLRPERFKDFAGQEKTLENLQIFVFRHHK